MERFYGLMPAKCRKITLLDAQFENGVILMKKIAELLPPMDII